MKWALRGAFVLHWCALDHSQIPSSHFLPRPQDLLGHQNRGPSVLGGESQGDLPAASFSVPARLMRSVLCGPLLQARAPFCAGLWRACGLAVKWLRLYLLRRPPGEAPPLAVISPPGQLGGRITALLSASCT